MGFNGTVARVEDIDGNKAQVKMGSEVYETKSAPILAGNLFMGEPYLESTGLSLITCSQTGCIAEVNFKPRKGTEQNVVEAIVKDGDGKPCYEIKGKYTEKLVAKNLESGESWTIFEAPEKPNDWKKMFFFSQNALQLNMLSDTLA